jgi:HEAT repeat protein
MAITLDDINKWAKKKNKGKLLSSLATDNYKLQVAAINALADIGGEEIVEPLIKMLKKEAKTEIIDDKYLGPMTKEIMAKNPGSSLDALIKNMNWDEGYREIRKAAAKALGMLRSPKSIESLNHNIHKDN